MHSTTRRYVLTLLAPLAASLVATAAAPVVAGPAAAGPAAAATDHRHGSPWTPYRTEEVVVPAARSTCGFDTRITPIRDEEEYRTTSTWPDGTPRTQLFRGALVERYTNLSTGASVVRDLSATAVFAYHPDGSPASLTSVHGAFGTTMPPGSTPDTGLYVLSGHGTRVVFEADGTRSLTLGRHGRAEDVCAAIDRGLPGSAPALAAAAPEEVAAGDDLRADA